MAAPSIIPITSLEDFVTRIEEFSKQRDDVLWYRGCGREHTLVPSLYRHPEKTDVDELLRIETQLLAWFKQRSVPYQTRPLGDDAWERLFFMQHFRIPTRLLDWTENPFIALYFALTCDQRPSEDAAVWVLRPSVWNEKTVNKTGVQGQVYYPGDEDLAAYEPGRTRQGKLGPLALYGTHNSARIVAQRGTFMVFGKDRRPMEQMYDAESYPSDALVKIVAAGMKQAELRKALWRIGVTESVVFPELEGLAIEAKRIFGFEV